MAHKKHTESIHEDDYDRWGDMPGGNYIHVIPSKKEKNAGKKEEN